MPTSAGVPLYRSREVTGIGLARAVQGTQGISEQSAALCTEPKLAQPTRLYDVNPDDKKEMTGREIQRWKTHIFKTLSDQNKNV